eukprot:Skav225716  [mRNA]  locus=scaffold164:59777:61188:+ [translate_table: standard]
MTMVFPSQPLALPRCVCCDERLPKAGAAQIRSLRSLRSHFEVFGGSVPLPATEAEVAAGGVWEGLRWQSTDQQAPTADAGRSVRAAAVRCGSLAVWPMAHVFEEIIS